MGAADRRCPSETASAIARWRHVGGGADANGNPVVKPYDLYVAELVDALCQRYGALPSQVLAEDVEMLRMLAMISEGGTNGE